MTDNNEFKVTLTDVLHVPGLKKNLLSTKKLTHLRHEIHIDNNKAIFTNRHYNNQDFTVPYDGNMLVAPVTVEPIEEHALTAQTTGATLLDLHKHHIRIKCILKAAHDTNICIIGNTMIPTCKACIKAKSTQKPMDKGPAPCATELFELVHTNICGLVGTKSLRGKSYYVSFIDDYTRPGPDSCQRRLKSSTSSIPFSKPYQRTSKSSVYSPIEAVSTSMSHSRTTSRQLESLTNQLQHTPQYNEVAKCFNRTMLDMVCTMLFDANMSKGFWAEALATALYINN